MGETDVETEREVRARRILDVTAELVRRWGYKRTTIDDVARLAGIGKGTVYLHYKSRLALFQAVLLRESLRQVDDLLGWLAREPANVLVERYTAESFRLVMANPLLRAMFVRDAEVLGELAVRPEMADMRDGKDVVSTRWLMALRGRGLVRRDVAPESQLYSLRRVCLGFMLDFPGLDAVPEPDIGVRAECVAHVVRCSFGVDGAEGDPRLAEASAEVIGILTAFRHELAGFSRRA